jgi:hypothetical protein
MANEKYYMVSVEYDIRRSNYVVYLSEGIDEETVDDKVIIAKNDMNDTIKTAIRELEELIPSHDIKSTKIYIEDIGRYTPSEFVEQCKKAIPDMIEEA